MVGTSNGNIWTATTNEIQVWKPPTVWVKSPGRCKSMKMVQ